jgi:hypothetical protein
VVENTEVPNRSPDLPGLSILRRLAVAWFVSALPAAGAKSPPVDASRAGVASPGRPWVAILPFVGEDVDPEKLAQATNRFRSQLAATDSFRVVPASEVDDLLKWQRSKDSSACENNDCSLETGRQVGAREVFAGTVSQGVETWRLEVTGTNVESGQTVFDHLIEMYGSFDDLAGRGCYRMARMASGRESSDNNYTVLDGGGGGHVWPWVVGGVAVAAGGAAAAVLLLEKGASTPASTASSPDRLIVKW